MIDYYNVKVGDKLRITGVGAPGFAQLGDLVTVKSCNRTNRCDVVHDGTGAEAFFALTCGAARLEPAPASAVDDAGPRDWDEFYGANNAEALLLPAVVTAVDSVEDERLEVVEAKEVL